MLYTIIQIIAFQALFLLVYDLFLKRETFFNYNRAYLLISSVLSLVLPFVKLPELREIAAKDFVIQLPEVFIGTKTVSTYDIEIAEQAGIVLEQPETPVWQIIFFSGIAIATFIFILKITKLYWLKFKNPKRWKGNVLIVNLVKSSAAFSFFNTIFLGENIPETEKPTICKHELVHIKDLHTLDLLFFELLRIVFWFNPLVYIYQNRIKELHEYIADAKAVKQNGKADYYQSLLNQVFDVNNVSFTNTFFKKSLIKKRIAMLQKTKSKHHNLIKYALLIPMVFGMLVYSSTEVRAQQNLEKQEQVVDQELTDEELIEKYISEYAEMDKDGPRFKEIMESLAYRRAYKYIESKTEYLKFIAFGRFIMQTAIEKKSENGTLTDKDIDHVEQMKSLTKTYAEYREWKKTDEAKEQWELSTQGGILRLFVEDAANKTKKEQKRFDDLMKQLKTDSYFKKLVVADGTSTMVIDAPDKADTEIVEVQEIDEFVEVPFSVVEETPTLPECVDLPTNRERKNCMNTFVNKHIGKNFNTSVADSLPPGRKRIFVQFKIDKDGSVKNILARAPSEALEIEAKRVIATLPKFIPGKQKGKLVVVPFSIPIVFEVKGDKKDKLTENEKEQVNKAYTELVTQRDRVLKNSSEENPIVVKLNKQIDSLRGKLEYKLDSLKTKDYNKYIDQLEARAKKDSVELDNIPYSVVEVAPYVLECKSFNTAEERKNCTNRTINKFIGTNFKTNLAKELGVKGKQKIFANFVINKEGNVTNIKARASHEGLEAEVIRVIKMLPQFIPGQQKGRTVNVPYSIPIVFQVADTKKD